jgi:hypothetical protein
VARGLTGAARRALTLALGAATALGPHVAAPALAGTEEFSTFHVISQEEDDESIIDHLLTRPPSSWRDEWERAPQALRSSQGCLTSGQWLEDTELKLQAPLGKAARFGLDYTQLAGDISTYDYLDFWFRFRLRAGTLGTMFRPMHDKSRQDLALAWELGADSSAFQLRAIYTLEDVFNNLWAFRQTRVGERSQPYLRHPWEPALVLASRHERWRAAFSGKFLTPSVMSVPGVLPGDPERRAGLWGTLASASLEAHALGFVYSARGHNHQALSSDGPADRSAADDRNFRRAWSGEVALTRDLRPWLSAEARWLYTDRTETFGVPTGPGSFRAIDRVLQVEGIWHLAPAFALRLGGLYDEITIARAGSLPAGSYGSRHESRATIGLDARFGRVSVAGVEGIELDPEPYEVWFHHDKAFLMLQTTF